MGKTKPRRVFSKNSTREILVVLIVVMLCVISSLLAYWVYQRLYPRVANPAEARGELRTAPEFNLADAAGKHFRLQDFRGSLVVIHFWASWCPPCLEEITQWIELGAKFKGKPVKFVAISLDQNWQDAQKILPTSQVPENVLSLLDTSGMVPDHFGTYQFPETYLLNVESKILFKWVGPQDWSNPEVFKFLETIRLKIPPVH